jgi:hypothetical protein
VAADEGVRTDALYVRIGCSPGDDNSPIRGGVLMTITDKAVTGESLFCESSTGTCEAANFGGEGVRTGSASGVGVHCAEEDG